jgi:2-hydroxychromene-2-carboxylate isomerase
MHWLELRPQTRVSGLRLKFTNAMRVVTEVALTGMLVVTQDFGRKSKLKFLVLTQVVFVSQAGRNSRVHCIAFP